MTYDVVFDAAASGCKSWPFAAAGLLFVAIGVVLVVLARAFRSRLRKRAAWFAYFFLVFAGLWTVVAFASTHGEYAKVRDALLRGRAEVVEGRVEDFSPMPYSGHATEHFTVCGVPFAYSDYVITAGFNQTSSHGGPVRAGSWVRITHVGSIIARLEIARDAPGAMTACARSGRPAGP